ncbi:MAG: hypothetical protein KatS3mg105_1486 [Gemmatales bacterium]|nr:MAG: hypothetical protein KatS3mg105_1486 [Gemmatales bacterium]
MESSAYNSKTNKTTGTILLLGGSVAIASAIAFGLSYWTESQVGQGVFRPAGFQRDFRPVRVVPPFPPIVQSGLRIGTVKQADKFLNPNELILGVSLDGANRAYPINMLTGPDREIFNDTLAGEPIAATW